MEVRGKEGNVAVSQCEDPELLAGLCQVTWKQVQILNTGSNCLVDQKFVSSMNQGAVPSVCHGYCKTCRYEVMGFEGMGTVVNFSTPQHTAYLYHSIAGMDGYITAGVSLIFTVFELFFLIVFINFIMSHRDTTKYSYASHMSTLPLCSVLSLTPIPHPKNK